jgi:hypothetical protein
MSTPTSVTCPACAAQLVAEGLGAGQRVLCAACRRAFRLGTPDRAASGPGRSPMTYSRCANASRLLGMLSFLPLVGLAAAGAGTLGLLDLRRHPGRAGWGRALFGLAAGVLTTAGWLVFGVVFGVVAYVIHSSEPTTDANEIAAIAAAIGPFTVPDGFEPVDGKVVPVVRVRSVRYMRRSKSPPPDTVLVVCQLPPNVATDPDAVYGMARGRAGAGPDGIWSFPEQESEVTYTICGKPVAVQLRTGKDTQDSSARREYFAYCPGEHRRLGILVVTREVGGMGEAEVQEFLESFR